jgi:hypothetical protein
MAKEKATITVDRSKLEEARAAIGATSASETIDVALSELLRRSRRRRDVEAYSRDPLTEEESAIAGMAVDWSALADDTDWEALWPEDG